uniref:glutathione transferase n=1 Tax=Anser brachyrhynchus TaxID=132585 RepID=A0A8B9CU17_9AVES
MSLLFNQKNNLCDGGVQLLRSQCRSVVMEAPSYLRLLFLLLFVLRIDMYVGGTEDLMGFILMFPFLSAEDKEKQRALIVQKATSRYFPVYEKVLKDHGQDFLVGNSFSWADVHLLEAILMVEEKKSDVLSSFPQLQAFKRRISSIPTIKKFLEPGSQRKPVPDDKYVETVRRVLRMYYDIKAN